MKSIWVVEQGEYSDYHVVGAFTSEENARLIADEINKHENCYQCTVAEWQLDPGVEDLHAGRIQHNVWMLRDGTVEKTSKSEELSPYRLGGEEWIWRRSQAHGYIGTNTPDCLVVTTWAKTEKQAIKAANEARVRLIAEGKWD